MLKFQVTRWDFEATINEPSTSIILSSNDIKEVISILEVEAQTLENELSILVLDDYNDYLDIIDNKTIRTYLDSNVLYKHLKALNDYHSNDTE